MAKAKRPWQGAETHLGLNIFGRDVGGRQRPSAGVGWALLRLRPPVINEGSVDILPTLAQIDLDLTGAEYRTLREDCGLSIAEAADFHGVREGAIKAWERKGPPSGAAGELATLRARIESAAAAALEQARRIVTERADMGGVDLYRYEAWAYPHSQPATEGLPHGAHNRLIARTADLLAVDGISVAIRYGAVEP